MRWLLLLLAFAPLAARTTYHKPQSLWEEPWGWEQEVSPTPSKTKNPITLAAKSLIQFHKKVLSPTDGKRSHYAPNSSGYTYQAIEKYGLLKGWIMGCDRLMRENSDPWIYPEVDVDQYTLKEDPP